MACSPCCCPMGLNATHVVPAQCSDATLPSMEHSRPWTVHWALLSSVALGHENAILFNGYAAGVCTQAK